MNCEQCKAPLPSGVAYCPECGAKAPMTDAPTPPIRKGARTLSNRETIAPIRESRASALEPGTRFADRYEVVRKLGEGGMGVVYVARDTNTGGEMVLKLIHPDLVAGEDAIRRLMAEGLTARQIRHPNIVAVYDVALCDGQPYFTMEFVRGGSLRTWMVNRVRSAKDVTLDTAAGLVRTMLAGLAEAHRMGVVHRDLKPENVLLAGDPDAGNFDLKILDFGIAKAIDAPVSGGGGGAIGTPLYMAPEQMTSAEAVGPAADLYSLSVMFYELLMEASPQARWEPVSKNRSDVPKAIDDLIEKGLSARPRSRYASAAEYQTALDKAMAVTRPAPNPPPPSPPEPPPPLPPPPPPPPPAKNWWASLPKKTRMWISIGGAVVVLAVIGGMQPDDVPPAQPIQPTQPGGGPQVQPVQPTQPQIAVIPEVRQPVTPQPPVFSASGTWRDDFGNAFAVQHDGANFTATGIIAGFGPVVMRGALTVAGTSFGVFTPTGVQVYQGAGQLRQDGRHIDYQLRDSMGNISGGALHINHAPGQ